MKSELELAEILDRCLEQMRTGMTAVEVLRQYPDDAEQLRPLLGLAAGLEALPEPPYSLDGAMRTMLKAATQEKVAATTIAQERGARSPASQLVQSLDRARTAAARWFDFRPVMLFYRMAAVTVVLLFLFWGGGVLSANAAPGDFLYPLKLMTERVRFFLTVNAEDKAELRMVFSSERLREAIKQHQRDGKLDPALLQEMLDEAREAVALSVDLPKGTRELLVAQNEHLSQFQGQELARFQQKLPAQEQAVVAPFVELSGRRAQWMRQMCDDWGNESDTAPAQKNSGDCMDICPD